MSNNTKSMKNRTYPVVTRYTFDKKSCFNMLSDIELIKKRADEVGDPILCYLIDWYQAKTKQLIATTYKVKQDQLDNPDDYLGKFTTEKLDQLLDENG